MFNSIRARIFIRTRDFLLRVGDRIQRFYSRE